MFFVLLIIYFLFCKFVFLILAIFCCFFYYFKVGICQLFWLSISSVDYYYCLYDWNSNWDTFIACDSYPCIANSNHIWSSHWFLPFSIQYVSVLFLFTIWDVTSLHYYMSFNIQYLYNRNHLLVCSYRLWPLIRILKNICFVLLCVVVCQSFLKDSFI